MVDLYIFYFLFFALGSVFGSFLNLVSDRVVSGETILFGRSRCDHCKKTLNAKNLIPYFSYLFQRGKSSCCGQKLSWLYPVSELLTGISFLFATYYSRIFIDHSLLNVLTFMYLLTILSFFVVLFLTDVKYRLLPDKLAYPAIILAVFFILLITFLDLKFYHDKLASDTIGVYLLKTGFWYNHFVAVVQRLVIVLISAIVISLFFISLIVVTRGRGMGGGDVKLGFLIGLFNGFPNNILAVFLGFLLGSLYSIILIILKRKSMKDTIAFGPFLIIGSLIAFIWGQQIMTWYFGIF